jgi:hypothetical protein
LRIKELRPSIIVAKKQHSENLEIASPSALLTMGARGLMQGAPQYHRRYRRTTVAMLKEKLREEEYKL